MSPMCTAASAKSAKLPPGVSRSKIPFLVKDMVRVSDPVLIRKIATSPDIGRPAQGELPLFIRTFFSASKFYHVPTQRFASVQEGDNENERPKRLEIVESLLAPGFTDAHLQRLEALLKGNGDYEQVGMECAKIMADLLLPLPEGEQLPDEIAQACFRTLIGSNDTFNPVKLFRGRSSRKMVEDYLAKLMPDEPHPADYLHNVTAAAHGLGQAILSMREMATDDVRVHFKNNPLTLGIMRIPLRDTTLDGLFPEDAPLRRNETIVLLEIGEATKETQDDLFLFGAGIEFRQCPFKSLFFKTTAEIKKDKNAS